MCDHESALLAWTSHMSPDDTCNYDHITTTTTPLGPITIEWKSWKDYPGYTALLPWWEATAPAGAFISADSLDAAKAMIQTAWNKKAAEVAAFCRAERNAPEA